MSLWWSAYPRTITGVSMGGKAGPQKPNVSQRHTERPPYTKFDLCLVSLNCHMHCNLKGLKMNKTCLLESFLNLKWTQVALIWSVSFTDWRNNKKIFKKKEKIWILKISKRGLRGKRMSRFSWESCLLWSTLLDATMQQPSRTQHNTGRMACSAP